MFHAFETRGALAPIPFGTFATREAARDAILAHYGARWTLAAFELDGDNAADMAIATRLEMRLFAIERA